MAQTGIIQAAPIGARAALQLPQGRPVHSTLSPFPRSASLRDAPALLLSCIDKA